MTGDLAKGQQGQLGHIGSRRYEQTATKRSHISKPPARSVPASEPHPSNPVKSGERVGSSSIQERDERVGGGNGPTHGRPQAPRDVDGARLVDDPGRPLPQERALPAVRRQAGGSCARHGSPPALLSARHGPGTPGARGQARRSRDTGPKGPLRPVCGPRLHVEGAQPLGRPGDAAQLAVHHQQHAARAHPVGRGADPGRGVAAARCALPGTGRAVRPPSAVHR